MIKDKRLLFGVFIGVLLSPLAAAWLITGSFLYLGICNFYNYDFSFGGFCLAYIILSVLIAAFPAYKITKIKQVQQFFFINSST